MKITPANIKDLAAILRVQKAAFQSEAERYNDFEIQPLRETLAEIEIDLAKKTILKAEINQKLVASIRAVFKTKEQICELSRLSVLPQYQGKGIATKLLTEIEKYFPKSAKFVLATGAESKNNIQLYQKIGYQIAYYGTFHDGVKAVFMTKTKN